MAATPADNPPVTDDDRAFWLAQERHLLRDACPSDSQLDAYRVETERQIGGQRERDAPEWIVEQTRMRLSVIVDEIAQRHRLAERGGPAYAPETFYREWLDQVRAVVDIEAILGEGGVLFHPSCFSRDEAWALCPFHTENSPSFHVDRDKKVWHCFGCGQGGDVFTFMELRGGMTFMAAAEYLGKRFGVTLEKPKTQQRLRPLDEGR